MNKPAKQIGTGETIKVNTGKGLSTRIVDRIKHDSEKKTVTLTLYTESGVRPKLTFAEDTLIEMG